MIFLVLAARIPCLVLCTHPGGLAGREVSVLLILKCLSSSLSLECLLKAELHWRKLKQYMKEVRLSWNGICGMPLFWMSCRLPNSTETQIKTVICQLKQDFTQSQSGLYTSRWHGPNLNTVKTQNRKTTNLTIEEETTGFLQATSSASTLSTEVIWINQWSI